MTRRAFSLLLCLLLVGGIFSPAFNKPLYASEAKVVDLVAERALGELESVLPSGGKLDVQLAETAVTKGSILKEFWIDPDSGQFITNVVTKYGETHRVWGVVLVTFQVPVPITRLLPGEIIHDTDLTLLDIPHQRVGAFAVREMEELVGQQVRRMLLSGRPVPRQSVIPPIVIQRGEKVTIVLSHGGLSLTDKGRAMSDAHAGQILRVVNLSSNKTVFGLATAAGIVEVTR